MVNKPLENLKQNYSKALGHLRKTANITIDPDLSLYKKLSPEALKALRDHYGDDQMEQYIIEMEKRKEERYGESS